MIAGYILISLVSIVITVHICRKMWLQIALSKLNEVQTRVYGAKKCGRCNKKIRLGERVMKINQKTHNNDYLVLCEECTKELSGHNIDEILK